MEQIADAPWIRDAENNGPDTGEEICCPVCGFKADAFYRANGEIIGCEGCITTVFWWELQDDE